MAHLPSRGKFLVQMALQNLSEHRIDNIQTDDENPNITFGFPELNNPNVNFSLLDTISSDIVITPANEDLLLSENEFTNLETMPLHAISEEQVEQLDTVTFVTIRSVTEIINDEGKTNQKLDEDVTDANYIPEDTNSTSENDSISKSKQEAKEKVVQNEKQLENSNITFSFPELNNPNINVSLLDTISSDIVITPVNEVLLLSENEFANLEAMPFNAISEEQVEQLDTVTFETIRSVTEIVNDEGETNQELDEDVTDANYIPEDTNSTNGNESISNSEQEAEEEMVHNEEQQEFTKKGLPRKRRKFTESVTVRKEKKASRVREIHKVKVPCGETCKMKCRTKITEERRVDINTQFWNLEKFEQRNFMLQNTSKSNVRRRTVEPRNAYKRNATFQYMFKNANGEQTTVCKIFFLTTMGFKPNQTKMLRNVLSSNPKALTPNQDKRKNRSPANKIDHNVIVDHIESFQPQISHYRREHAPNRRYLPSDLSVKKLFDDFKRKFPGFVCSYDLYRTVLKDLRISFVKLGHEECENCEYFFLHNKEHDKNNLHPECDICKEWNQHIQKAEKSRMKYREYATREPVQGEIVFSVDLEKVIMLPRCDMFKTVIFTTRLTSYNESFVPVGTKQNKNIKPHAVIWHKAITGRKKEDIISAFYTFFLHHRDEKKIILWLDNCSAQNKNWTLFTFLIYIVNSKEVSAESVEINYFEPGHTFMSADSFHHQVEMSLKRHGKVYDFQDFQTAVQAANSSKVIVTPMEIGNFYDWKDFSSTFKINKIVPRPYMKDIIQIFATRGKRVSEYKTEFDDNSPVITLNFLNSKVQKNGVPDPRVRTEPTGISKENKKLLISAISKVVPENRMAFWKNLPEKDE